MACIGQLSACPSLVEMRFVAQEKVWLKRARKMATYATMTPGSGYSHYKSMTSMAALPSDLSYPEAATMPLFDRETPLPSV